MKYVTLSNGIDCPVIGLGTFMLSPKDVPRRAPPPNCYHEKNQSLNKSSIVIVLMKSPEYSL
jgi:hypothetical protein